MTFAPSKTAFYIFYQGGRTMSPIKNISGALSALLSPYVCICIFSKTFMVNKYVPNHFIIKTDFQGFFLCACILSGDSFITLLCANSHAPNFPNCSSLQQKNITLYKIKCCPWLPIVMIRFDPILCRIHLAESVKLRAPVSESLSRLHRDQLQKFAQVAQKLWRIPMGYTMGKVFFLGGGDLLVMTISSNFR